METITYNLSSSNRGENNFYDELASFTDKMLADARIVLGREIEELMLNTDLIDEKRSFDEYLIDYISIGIYWYNYISNALRSNKLSISVLRKLYELRKQLPKWKSKIDHLRGFLTTKLLISKRKKYNIEYSKKNYLKLINWLKSTGEFNEEYEKLIVWKRYFDTVNSKKTLQIIQKTIGFSIYFTEECHKYLGTYTSNIQRFLSHHNFNYKNREDYIFCGREENEYWFNMFAAEILNRILRKRFENTKKKVVLLPSCMSKPENNNCKAVVSNEHLICRSCTPECSINKIKQKLVFQDIETVLIPHSSNFSKFLQRWKNQDVTGLVGVACVLNLLSGGYEMQKLNIPSQCVFLDYCGCKKHWHKNGIPTNINESQLRKILSTRNNTLNKEFNQNHSLNQEFCFESDYLTAG